MSVQLGTYQHNVIAKKDGVYDGQPHEFHGTKDQRWHCSDRANQLFRAGWTIVDFQIRNYEGEWESDPKGWADYQKRYLGGSTPETTMKVDFIEQEELNAPVVDLQKLAVSISQSINRGKLPVDSANMLATQSLLVLKTLKVEPAVILEAVKLYFPELFERKHRENNV